ncbi:MAG: phosphatidate cytidylyltransferase [Desulfitobacteriaceae bacterium]
MGTRMISAIVGGALLLGLTYLGGFYSAILVIGIALLGLHEFMRLIEKLGSRAWYSSNMIGAALWLLVVFFGGQAFLLPGFVLWLLYAGGRFALGYPRMQLAEALYNFLSVIYTAGLMAHFLLLRGLPLGMKWTFVTFFLVWATDIGAYLIGKGVGRHLLAPLVSPKKTIEGSVGGLLLTLIVALLLGRWVNGVSGFFLLGLALVVGISAQVGDLFESALKRAAGIKDSGTLIPGHGGILDRFDSFVFALPLVYYLVSYLQ